MLFTTGDALLIVSLDAEYYYFSRMKTLIGVPVKSQLSLILFSR